MKVCSSVGKNWPFFPVNVLGNLSHPAENLSVLFMQPCLLHILCPTFVRTFWGSKNVCKNVVKTFDRKHFKNVLNDWYKNQLLCL